jgi:hypothetical protein
MFKAFYYLLKERKICHKKSPKYKKFLTNLGTSFLNTFTIHIKKHA